LDTKPPSHQALSTELPSQQALDAQPEPQPVSEIKKDGVIEDISYSTFNTSLISIPRNVHQEVDVQNSDMKPADTNSPIPSPL